MKNNSFFILCIFVFTLLFASACEQTDLQASKSAPDDTQKIETRGECEECPEDNECCCAVWLQELETDASLFFCGTSNGATGCTGAPSCLGSTFSGMGDNIMLNDLLNPRQVFCIYENGGFWILNTSTTEVARIYITCQDDILNPGIVPLTIQPQGKVYYKPNSSCELGPCS